MLPTKANPRLPAQKGTAGVEGKRTMVLTPENWATEDDGEIIIVEEDTAPDLISAVTGLFRK